MRTMQIVRQPVVAATRDAPVRDIAARLASDEFSGMPVADPTGPWLGWSAKPTSCVLSSRGHPSTR
jgi:hypothetical protein